MIKKTLLILVPLALLGGLIAYRINTNAAKEAKQSGGGKANGGGSPKKESVVYGKIIHAQAFANQLTLSGNIEPDEQVDIQSEISGLVENINFQEGARISKGQTLVSIKNTELKAQLAQANTKYNLAKENLRRAVYLLEKEAISQEEVDILSAEVATSEAGIELIKAQINKTLVTAPFSGKIGSRNIALGSYITPSTVIAKLVNSDRVKISFSIPEKYAHLVKVNSNIDFTVQGIDKNLSAKIYLIEPMIETNTRTLLVKAIANNTDKNATLIPGMFADINFPLETIDKALLVPAEALIPIQNGKKLFVVKEGQAKEVIVQMGARTKDDVLILSGVSEGDTVLTTGIMSLRNGSPVNVTLR